jgi:hypothetical protein
MHIPPKPSGEGCEAAGAILRLLLFMALKTNVYIDGFNLYYGCVRDTPHKWLDLSALCARLLPTNQINSIRYFTAWLRRALGIRSSERDRKCIFALFAQFRISPSILAIFLRVRFG